MKNLFFVLGIISLTICGIMLSISISKYFETGIDKYFTYQMFGAIGSLLAGINLIYKARHISK
jgi:hypothetical protein